MILRIRKYIGTQPFFRAAAGKAKNGPGPESLRPSQWLTLPPGSRQD
jgi:hypothetical protein